MSKREKERQGFFDILTCMTEKELRDHRTKVENLGSGEEWRYTFPYDVTDDECNGIIDYLTAGLDVESWGIPNNSPPGSFVVSISKKRPIEYE